MGGLMKEFFILIAAILVWGGVWRIAASRWAKRGKGKLVRNAGGAIVGSVASSILLLVLLPSPSPSPSHSGDAREQREEPSATENKPDPSGAPAVSADASSERAEGNDEQKVNSTLEFTPKEFQDRFNKNMVKIDLPYRAKLKTKRGTGNLDGASAVLSDHLAITATIDKKTGKLTGMLMIGTGDGSLESGANVLLAGIAAIAAAVPNGTTESIGPRVIDLMSEFKAESSKPASKVLNGVRFSFNQSSELGTWFSASPV